MKSNNFWIRIIFWLCVYICNLIPMALAGPPEGVCCWHPILPEGKSATAIKNSYSGTVTAIDKENEKISIKINNETNNISFKLSDTSSDKQKNPLAIFKVNDKIKAHIIPEYRNYYLTVDK